MPRRPPLVGDEKSTLHAALALHRDVVLWKVEGLGDEQVRRPIVASGTNLLGLLKHPAGVEYEWLVKTFDRPAEPLETDPVRDMKAGEDETTEDVVSFYRRACAAADEVIEQLTSTRRHGVVQGGGLASPRPRRRDLRDRPARRAHGHPS